MADNSKLLLYGGIAVAAWYLYENWATLFPSAAAAPTAPATPASGTGTGTPSTSSGGTSTPSGSTAGTGGNSSPSLASILSGLTAKAMGSGDPAVTISGGVPFAAPDVFNYYLAEVYSGSSPAGWPPDVAQVFPGVDRTKPMSISQYWGGMSAFLSSKAGLSGVLSGLGMLVNAGRQWPELATEPWNGGKWPAGQGWWQGGGRAVQ